jgi:hypothetical protein
MIHMTYSTREDRRKRHKELLRKRLKLPLKFAVILFCFSLVLYLLGLIYPRQVGFYSEKDLLVFSLVLWVIALFIINTSAYILKLKKAEEREIRAEDDILLQGIAFSQSALWIYLNIIQANLFVNILKVFLPTFAVIFYSVRAYAKLKDSNKWRYNSLFLLAIILSISVWVGMGTTSSGLLGKTVIESSGATIDYTVIYLVFLAFSFYVAPATLILLKEELKKRYGLITNTD